MKERLGYTFSNKLNEDCNSKARALIDDFYASAFPSEITELTINHAKSSIYKGLKMGIKHGIYIYDVNDELVGLAIYEKSTDDDKAISIDLIDFDPVIRKSFVDGGLDGDDKKPSDVLTRIIEIIATVSATNHKNKVKLGLSSKTLPLATLFEHLGFKREDSELKGVNIDSKRLVNINNGRNSNNK